MIYSLPQNQLKSSEAIDLVDRQSRQWSMLSNLLLLAGMLLLFTHLMNKPASLTVKSSDIHNIVNLQYRTAPPEPKPAPASPPKRVESVPQKVQEIPSEPTPVADKKVKKFEEAALVKPISAVRKKKKPTSKPVIASAAVAQVESIESVEPVQKVVEVTQEPATYLQTQVDSIPAALSKDKPSYPYRARRMNVTGFVEIRFLVNKKGRVQELEIIHAKPEGVFEESVRETVMGWRFNPGIKNNRSVATWMVTTINFEFE